MADWNAEATKYAKKMGTARGVKAMEQPGVSVVFGPETEIKQVIERLRNGGVEIVGTGLAHISAGAYAFAIVCKTDDVKQLKSITGF